MREKPDGPGPEECLSFMAIGALGLKFLKRGQGYSLQQE
jgi:hypothetical protein